MPTEGAPGVVVWVSLAAAALLFVTFFGVVELARRRALPRAFGAALAGISGGFGWAVVVLGARSVGLVRTEEATFHHLYVLAVVGLPVVGAVLIVTTWRRSGPGSARRFGVAVGVLFVLPALGGLWATHIEPSWLRVDHRTVDVDAIGPDDAPIRVAVIADIQTDSFGDHERRAIELVMAESPDIVLVAGDLTQVNSTVFERIRADGVAVLSMLEAAGGVYVIDGNTDPSPAAIRAVAVDAGLTSLIDETVVAEVRGVDVRIGGLGWPNNLRAEGTGFLRSFAAGGGERSVDLLLAHSPDVMLNGVEWGAVDLVVTGHTHGGQIAVPFVGPLWNVTEMPTEVAAGGLHPWAGTQLYVSTGVGVGRGESPKVRFLVRPSVTILDLT